MVLAEHAIAAAPSREVSLWPEREEPTEWPTRRAPTPPPGGWFDQSTSPVGGPTDPELPLNGQVRTDQHAT
jgi:hypothetical protein